VRGCPCGNREGAVRDAGKRDPRTRCPLRGTDVGAGGSGVASAAGPADCAAFRVMEDTGLRRRMRGTGSGRVLWRDGVAEAAPTARNTGSDPADAESAGRAAAAEGGGGG